jgi:hypothetical protein
LKTAPHVLRCGPKTPICTPTRIKARRDAKKAIVAVAASMLTAAWHMLRDGVGYADLGADYFLRHNSQKTVQQLLRRLADLGYPVQPASPPLGASYHDLLTYQ